MLKTEVGTELEPSLRTKVLGLEQRFVSHNRAPLTLGYESTVGPSVTTEWGDVTSGVPGFTSGHMVPVCLPKHHMQGLFGHL